MSNVSKVGASFPGIGLKVVDTESKVLVTGLPHRGFDTVRN